LDFFKAVPLLNDYPRFRRLSFNRGGLASGGKEFSTSRLDRGLGFLSIGLSRLSSLIVARIVACANARDPW